MLIKERWLESIFNNSSVGILIVNKNRNILDINKTFCQMLGYEYSELLNKSTEILHISHESYLKSGEIIFDNVFKKNTLNLEYKFKHKKGYAIWLKVTGDMINDKEEVLWIVTDINQRVLYQEELINLNDTLNSKIENQVKILREKDKQLQYQSKLAQMGEMLNMISHQWRQPLMSISATTSYLTGKLLIDEFEKTKFLEELELIENSTEYLSNTINDFRNFFKIDKKKVLVNLNDIVKNTLKIIKPILINSHIEIIIDFKSSSEIYTFENEIKQVLLSILKNAEDAFLESNCKNKKIIIKTYEKEGYVFLEISDNAGGIKTSNLKKVFDSYFTTKSDTNGTGLGLCMSKTIIEDNCKGYLTVCNNEGSGATFIIKLPIKN